MTRRVAAVVLAMLVAVAACGDDEGGGDVRFAEGQIPASVPSDFPVPSGGVIGDTMIDTVNHRTEFTVSYQESLDEVVQQFTIGLVERGYVVSSSEALSGTSWKIEFIRGELIGSVLFSSTSGGLTQAVVGMNVT